MTKEENNEKNIIIFNNVWDTVINGKRFFRNYYYIKNWKNKIS